ncbi:hypothetical protein C4D60_Mb09t00080 [Musa balbisiana]|uniref:Uncharacterized protein n=1 Tax=Musa balbisiana TaxID=52838 RepID=A0A4S8ICW2_MUSBA|nr:hypothetical protein C4D60_Mb09t00080 [Musa balbisiana]
MLEGASGSQEASRPFKKLKTAVRKVSKGQPLLGGPPWGRLGPHPLVRVRGAQKGRGQSDRLATIP